MSDSVKVSDSPQTLGEEMPVIRDDPKWVADVVREAHTAGSEGTKKWWHVVAYLDRSRSRLLTALEEKEIETRYQVCERQRLHDENQHLRVEIAKADVRVMDLENEKIALQDAAVHKDAQMHLQWQELNQAEAQVDLLEKEIVQLTDAAVLQQDVVEAACKWYHDDPDHALGVHVARYENLHPQSPTSRA